MTIAVEILCGWFVLSLISAPVLIPLLVRRFAKHEEWIKETPRFHQHRTVTPQIRMLRHKGF